MAETSCRVDVWLWRARLARTRTEAARIVESGRVHRLRGDERERIAKAAKPIKVGDGLIFALGGRLTAVRVADLGARRGPPAEGRGLYAPLDDDGDLNVGSLSAH